MNTFPIFSAIALCMISPFGRGQGFQTRDQFQSGGKTIQMETFGVRTAVASPSIIVLHGATGVEFANRFIAALAQGIAEHGFVVHLVHYFDRTGLTSADDEAIKRSSGEWLQTVDDAVNFVRAQRGTAKIGLFGYSLGGYLAAAEAVKNPDVAAAVVLAGGLDSDSARTARRAPPVLILHGSADVRVPVTEAQNLEAVLKRLGGEPEVHIYSGEGHIMKALTYVDVVSRSAEFFVRRLRRPEQ